jgi:hypothetical protein
MALYSKQRRFLCSFFEVCPCDSQATGKNPSNVGCLGGLVAQKRGEAHLSGTHLLNLETGVYNDVSAMQQPLAVCWGLFQPGSPSPMMAAQLSGIVHTCPL